VLTEYQETSSIARQEVNKMKALAILTMAFLPATFAAVSTYTPTTTKYSANEP